MVAILMVQNIEPLLGIGVVHGSFHGPPRRILPVASRSLHYLLPFTEEEKEARGRYGTCPK